MAVPSLSIDERFAESTRGRTVALQFGATGLLCLVLTSLYGLWVGILPAIFLALALLGEALFVTLGLIAVLCYAYLGEGYGLAIDASEQRFGAGFQIADQMVALTTSPVLLAIPMFTLAGAIMTAGGIAQRLVRVMRASVGWMPGGLGISTIVACAFFAALSGSSAVTIIAIGAMLAPTLEKKYGRPFSLGLLTSCGAIGILAPPSLPLIVYGVISGADVNKLFIAGILPGLLTIGVLALFCVGKGIKLARQPFDGRELWSAMRHGALALALPPLLLAGIYGGVVTAGQASVLAVAYALLVEVFIHKEVKWKDLPLLTSDTMMLVGSILIILLMALALSNFLTLEEVPDRAAALIQTHITTPWGFLLALNVLLLIVGCIMDIFSAIVVMTPLILPIATAFGIDPIHLGIVMVVNLELGFATPPFGINLFISSAFFKRPVAEVFRATLPFLLLLLLALLAITRFPSISLGLVDRDDDGHSAFTGDCDDTDPRMNLADADGDGVTTCGGDCDDFCDTCKPGAPEIPGDWLDNDCDGESDEPEDGAEEKGASGAPPPGD
jgi:C4-dicarboxylate transporter DctM subunit